MTTISHAPDALGRDARNRALRTFVVGLLIDVLVAVAVVIVAATSQGDDPVAWGVLGASLAKTALATVGSYILRKFADPSNFPTPLPPAPTAAPAETEAGDIR